MGRESEPLGEDMSPETRQAVETVLIEHGFQPDDPLFTRAVEMYAGRGEIRTTQLGGRSVLVGPPAPAGAPGSLEWYHSPDGAQTRTALHTLMGVILAVIQEGEAKRDGQT